MMETTDFIAAVKRGDLDAVRAALQERAVLAKARDENGVSVVSLAIYRGHEQVAALLRQQRADLDVFEAAAIGDDARVAQLVAGAPALVNAFSADGFQPLGLAVFFGRLAVAEMLLAHGAEVNSPAKNPMRVCPLHSAVAHRDSDMALQLAARLLAAGAAVNTSQQKGFTPLHEAALRGHVELVRLLLQHGADAGARNEAGKNAMDLARDAGHAEVCALLSR